jgi:hypothetical protein
MAQVSTIAVPRLFHGGVPGLRPGDRLVPGYGHGRERIELARAGILKDTPPGKQGRVYLTPSRETAAVFAHMYPHGDVYRVDPVGPIEVSLEDGVADYTAGESVVVAAVDRAVELTTAELRRALRRYQRRRQHG